MPIFAYELGCFSCNDQIHLNDISSLFTKEETGQNQATSKNWKSTFEL